MHEENKIIADEPIELDPSELLGLSQVAKVSGVPGEPVLGRVLNKIGPEGPRPVDPMRLSLHSRLLSKIGETRTRPLPDTPLVARLLSKIGGENT